VCWSVTRGLVALGEAEAQRTNSCCRVDGCGYGVARGGMCQLHHQHWDRAGRPDLDGWLANPPAIKQPTPGTVCAIIDCPLWPQADLPFCHTHANTWRVNKRPDVAAFVERFARVEITEDQIVRVGGLTPQLRLEIQYALQCRRDQRTTKTLPAVVVALVRALVTANASSLLELTKDE
jgi:hypothetical protein